MQNVQNIAQHLRQFVEGMWFISESEFPFEVEIFETHTQLQTAFAVSEGETQSLTLSHFFRNATKIREEYNLLEIETAYRFRTLEASLSENLQSIAVWRKGYIEIDYWIIGQTTDFHWIALKTKAIET